MISTETTNVDTNNIKKLLDKVESAIRKEGSGIVNEECLDIKSKFNYTDFMLLRAFYRMLKYCLECDWYLSAASLEKMNLYMIRR